MLNALAYLGFHDLFDIYQMTIAEYEIRMEAYKLKQAEKMNEIAQQAWFNQMVKSTTGSASHPKPRYRRITDLFDYKKSVDKIRTEFEPNYQSQSSIPIVEERARIFAKRQAEFEQYWNQGLIKKKGG